mgnify:CR=1 FL=1
MTKLDVRAARPDQYVAGQKGDWEIIIGLEVHAQVTSQAKLFSGASAAYGGAPNAHVSLVDAAMPGMLPVINKFCVEQAIRTGLGLNAEIHKKSRFDRKNYFYPDLPQGYQISQFAMPIVGEGEIEVEPDGEESITVRIERLHLEQDAGKSIHDLSPSETYVDLNRAGVALMEIVSRPDIRSGKEAAAYFNKLRAILRALGTCDGNMEEGSMRADVNVSVRKPGTEFGTRCEIKNVNSTRFMMQAIEYEARRQIEILEGGGSIDQETRLFDANTGETRTMRSKEDAHDYRYFPDPDLLPLVLEQSWIDQIKASLPELPDAKKRRFIESYGLSAYDARVISSDSDTSAYFETVAKGRDPKLAANWVTQELAAALNKKGLELRASPVKAAAMGIGFWSMTSVATLTCAGSGKRSVIGTIDASSARAGASSAMAPPPSLIARPWKMSFARPGQGSGAAVSAKAAEASRAATRVAQFHLARVLAIDMRSSERNRSRGD